MRRVFRAGVAAIALGLLGAGSVAPAFAETADPGAIRASANPLPTATATPAAREAPTAARADVSRVLVISLPAVDWAQVRSAPMPHLHALLDQSAIADLSTRSVRLRTDATDGYLTLGAGTRTDGPSATGGEVLMPTEDYGTEPAPAVMSRRLGVATGTAIGALAWPSVVDGNRGLLFDSQPGALGDALAAHGVSRAVIANDDEDDLLAPDAVLHREAGLALVGSQGTLPGGDVGVDLNVSDPHAPFGVWESADQVMNVFAQTWAQKSVVLVEASDVARADAYRPYVADRQRARMLSEALRRTDALIGRLLAQVDPAHDAVIVVGPYHSRRQRELTIASLRAPGVKPGLLRSSTTRRDGFVAIVDVAPTILHLLGITAPEKMEGRPFVVSAGHGTTASRLTGLVRDNREAIARDSIIGTAIVVLVVASLVLVLAGFVLARRGRFPLPGLLRAACLGMIGFCVAPYLVRLFAFSSWGSGVYWAFVAGVSMAFAVLCLIAGRGHPYRPMILALTALVAFHVVDALVGAPFELNTVFGYTATVGIRVAGLGNQSFAALSAAALALSVLLAARRGRPGVLAATAILAVTAVVIAAPMFGQNFGGALACVPAFLLVGWLLWGRRVTIRSVVVLAVALVATGLIIGFVDLARPANSRTHVGRFFQKVGDEGFGGFTTVIHRKAQLMIQSFGNNMWVSVVIALVVFLVYAATRPHIRADLADMLSASQSALAGFALLAVLGLVLKDSGIAVPGMMLAVFVPAAIYVLTLVSGGPRRRRSGGPDRRRGPGQAPGGAAATPPGADGVTPTPAGAPSVGTGATSPAGA